MTRLTIPELAAHLRCGEWAAARLVRTGQIEGSKVAGRWLVTEQAADAYVASQSNQAPSRQRRRRRAS